MLSRGYENDGKGPLSQFDVADIVHDVKSSYDGRAREKLKNAYDRLIAEGKQPSSAIGALISQLKKVTSLQDFATDSERWLNNIAKPNTVEEQVPSVHTDSDPAP